MDIPPLVNTALEKARRTFRRGSVLGIDVGSSSAKIVQLGKDERGMVLETYGSIELAPYVGGQRGECVQLSPLQCGTALLDLMAAVATSARRGAASIPFASVFTAIIETPKRDLKQLKHILPTEAQRYIPVSSESVALDWEVLHTNEPVHPFEQAEGGAVVTVPTQKVLLVAVRKETLEGIALRARETNLSLHSEVEMFSTARTLRMSDALTGTTLFIDMGAAGSTAYILNDQGQPLLSHYIEGGGMALSKRIAEDLHIPFAEAESLKRSSGLHGSATALIEQYYTRIFEEAARTAYEYERQQGETIDRAMLAGGGALTEGVLPLAENHLSRKTIIAPAFQKVQKPEILAETLNDLSPLYTVATGLALREL